MTLILYTKVAVSNQGLCPTEYSEHFLVILVRMYYEPMTVQVKYPLANIVELSHPKLTI
jgi:hypothetical protein